MNVLHVTDVAERDACLARLCAEHYGQTAGLAPLVTFSGTRRILFAEEAARLFAWVGGAGEPQALALLVLDEAGEGMSLTLSCSLVEDGEPRRRLVADLALKAPLRVNAVDSGQEDFYRTCGITRWFVGHDGMRIGLAAHHPGRRASELSPALTFDERVILRRFKRDGELFETEKQAFIDGLAAFPGKL